MRKVFRLLGIIAEAIFDVAEDKPVENNLGRYRARELFDAGMISGSQYNEARNADSE
tara:strand:- start:1275 stop:1445 length:171 start_codon:yes stop_codon:yes gene_type:complete